MSNAKRNYLDASNSFLQANDQYQYDHATWALEDRAYHLRAQGIVLNCDLKVARWARSMRRAFWTLVAVVVAATIML